ncbi:TM2 domain-containing protein [Aurantiacibacter sp. MUD11]|uniref:TM2 domain-containing protein n=1 Tax=Aurantiacibacter sp. MUD11 TaxID=3003265 RepID=UPI0022AAEADA|nr:TM2 domain-containing protein [Aurantiacibacter sp. MUD11]WAT19017.1 TM2 domain-containing protein [Aurantiacibacter sp. MUD11]
MDPSTRDQLIYEAHRKSTGVAYLLWFFLGFFGAHRFYIGRTGSGVAQLLMCLSVIGIIPLAFWWLIDAFRIPDMVREENLDTIRQLGGHMPQNDNARLGPPDPEAPRRSLDPRVEEIREMRRR